MISPADFRCGAQISNQRASALSAGEFLKLKTTNKIAVSSIIATA